MRPTCTLFSSLCECAKWELIYAWLLPGLHQSTRSCFPQCSAVLVQANPVCLVQGRRPRQSIRDRGICPGVASGPLWDAGCGLGLGGRQERHWTRTEDFHSGSAQARLNESQRLPGSRGVSRQQHEKMQWAGNMLKSQWFHPISTGYWCSCLTSTITEYSSLARLQFCSNLENRLKGITASHDLLIAFGCFCLQGFGGYLTLKMSAATEKLFQCTVAMAPITDFRLYSESGPCL